MLRYQLKIRGTLGTNEARRQEESSKYNSGMHFERWTALGGSVDRVWSQETRAVQVQIIKAFYLP